MPELPEVETVVLSIRDQLVGQKFININVRWPKVLFNFSKQEFLEEAEKEKKTLEESYQESKRQTEERKQSTPKENR